MHGERRRTASGYARAALLSRDRERGPVERPLPRMKLFRDRRIWTEWRCMEKDCEPARSSAERAGHERQSLFRKGDRMLVICVWTARPNIPVRSAKWTVRLLTGAEPSLSRRGIFGAVPWVSEMRHRFVSRPGAAVRGWPKQWKCARLDRLMCVEDRLLHVLCDQLQQLTDRVTSGNHDKKSEERAHDSGSELGRSNQGRRYDYGSLVLSLADNQPHWLWPVYIARALSSRWIKNNDPISVNG